MVNNMAKNTEEDRDDGVRFIQLSAPENFYAPINAKESGRYATVSANGEGIGMLWTDDQLGFGYFPYAPDADALSSVRAINDYVATLNELKVPASDAFNVITLNFGKKEGYTVEQSSGTLDNVTIPDNVDTGGSPYSLVTEEGTDQVIALNHADDNGDITTRVDGKWEPVTDEDDPRVYGSPFDTVTKNAVDLFDKLEKTPKDQTIDKYKGVTVD